MTLKLQGLDHDHARRPMLAYALQHQGPETILELDLKLTVDQHSGEANKRFSVNLDVGPCYGSSAVEALRKAAEWCQRAAEALEKIDESTLVTVPVSHP